MAYKGLLIVALFWAFALFNTTHAQDKPIIRWLTWQQVPNFITKGPFAGQGLGDQITHAIQQKLPQYQHKNLISNANRYHSLIRQPDVCVAWAWIVPGSKEYRLHSRPVSLAPKTGILTLKSKAHLFGKPGDVLSLQQLLKKPKLTLGYLKAMVYTKSVHTLLDKYQLQGNVFTSARSEVQFDLKMLDTNRVDYFFAFPSQPIFNAKTKGIKNHYQFYNIDEIDKYTAMFSHCPKNDFGKKVMAQLDKIITNEFLMKHLKAVEKWNGKNKNYHDAFMNYVIKQIPHSQVTNPSD